MGIAEDLNGKLRLEVLGGDPEFEVWSGGTFVCANSVIRDDYDRNKEIGLDGQVEVLELRPYPGRPTRFISNFRGLLNKFHEEYEGYYLKVDGDTVPLGFHIHFGFNFWDKYNNKLCYLTTYFCYILDGIFFYRFKREHHGRARGGYLRPGAYEMKRYGFEYRSLPSRIAIHPDLLRTVYEICWKVGKWYWEKVVPEIWDDFDASVYRNYVTGPFSRKRIESLVGSKLTEKYFSLIDKLDEDTSRFLSNWGIEVKIPKLKIEFKDDWGSHSINTVKTIIQEFLKVWEGRIILFGLASSRGDTIWNNFDARVEGYGWMDDWSYPGAYNDTDIVIGLPYRLRAGYYNKELGSLIIRLLLEYKNKKES